jgi:hypothetical protein
MTQGAPKNTGSATKKDDAKGVEPKPGDETFDLDEYLAKRGFSGRRLMRVGGEWFEFDKAATSEQLISYHKTRAEQGHVEALACLLSDPDRATALDAAFDRQRQPIPADAQQDYLLSIVNYVLSGDPDLAEKAKADKEKAAQGESSAS